MFSRLAQERQQQQNVEDAVKEMQKPLARYIDDQDLDKMLREQEREGDPMAALIKKRKAKENKEKGLALGYICVWFMMSAVQKCSCCSVNSQRLLKQLSPGDFWTLELLACYQKQLQESLAGRAGLVTENSAVCHSEPLAGCALYLYPPADTSWAGDDVRM